MHGARSTRTSIQCMICSHVPVPVRYSCTTGSTGTSTVEQRDIQYGILWAAEFVLWA